MYKSNICVCTCQHAVSVIDVHLGVRAKWKQTEMREEVIVEEYFSGKWRPTMHVCCFDQLSLLNEANKHLSTHPLLSLTIIISLSLSPSHHSSFSPSSSTSFSFFSSSTHHPSLSPFFYGWVVIFPWDSGGGELSRACCFIIPNKTGNMFRPPCPGFSVETLKTETHVLFFLWACHDCTHTLHERKRSLTLIHSSSSIYFPLLLFIFMSCAVIYSPN